MVWLSFLVRIYTAAREVKRENDSGEGEGEGEKNCLHCLHWLLSSSPIARFRAMWRKRPLELSSPIAFCTRVTSHNSPKWGACSRATCYGELLRKKTKQGLQFSINLGRVFVFYNPPPPKWNEELLQSHLKKAGKSYHNLKCMCKKQQELQLSTHFAIVVSTRGRELFRLLTIVTWSLIQVESTLFTLMRNSVLGQEIYLVRIISISIGSHSVGFLSELEAKRLIFSDIFLRGCCVTSTVVQVYYAYCS